MGYFDKKSTIVIHVININITRMSKQYKLKLKSVCLGKVNFAGEKLIY